MKDLKLDIIYIDSGRLNILLCLTFYRTCDIAHFNKKKNELCIFALAELPTYFPMVGPILLKK